MLDRDELLARVADMRRAVKGLEALATRLAGELRRHDPRSEALAAWDEWRGR